MVNNCPGVGFPLKIEMTIRRISMRATTGSDSNNRLKGVDFVSCINSIQHAAWLDQTIYFELPNKNPRERHLWKVEPYPYL